MGQLYYRIVRFENQRFAFKYIKQYSKNKRTYEEKKYTKLQIFKQTTEMR